MRESSTKLHSFKSSCTCKSESESEKKSSDECTEAEAFDEIFEKTLFGSIKNSEEPASYSTDYEWYTSEEITPLSIST